MRIKEGDKWKGVFSMPKSAFELTVIFFGLINLLVTFQAMMNNLLRDMIEVEDMEAFISDMMVETEIEEEHNDIVEVLRRMAKNDLFVKLENICRRLER